MEKESKYKIIILAAVVFLIAAGFSAVFFGHFNFSVFLMISGFAIIFLLIIETYLRIQHNIDKIDKAVNLINELQKQSQNTIIELQKQSQNTIIELQKQSQNTIIEEVQDLKKINEDILDLLEILVNFLEKLEKKDNFDRHL